MGRCSKKYSLKQTNPPKMTNNPEAKKTAIGEGEVVEEGERVGEERVERYNRRRPNKARAQEITPTSRLRRWVVEKKGGKDRVIRKGGGGGTERGRTMWLRRWVAVHHTKKIPPIR